MILHLNGNPCEVEAGSLDALLRELGVEPEAVATALNGEFVPRGERADTPLAAGDKVELLSPMQGG
ncbi:sulfur carrier protein ThiS [Aureimonas sp. D3]|uniref:sulfur carrier protein ThiS n=1 Tax=Aureimonas sp. D3 TaxID=1638164 RepID=UPI0007829DDE|nr:sulfur carrier protein ThiS [Aureimonas sp. D3]